MAGYARRSGVRFPLQQGRLFAQGCFREKLKGTLLSDIKVLRFAELRCSQRDHRKSYSDTTVRYRIKSDESVSMTYDAEDRMITASGSGFSDTYTYDGDGRVKKSDGTLYWVDDNFHPLEIGTASGLTKDFVFMGDRRIAFVSLASGNSYYYLPDHLGSTAVIASGDGKTIQWDADYYPFGNQRHVFTSLVNNPFQFTGDEYDSDTGFDYSIARFEAGKWGRFNSPDPFLGSMDVSNPQSLNRYSYVLNEPVSYTDPSGLDCNVILAGVGDNPGNKGFTKAQGSSGIVGYPYAGQGLFSAIGSINSQSFSSVNDSTFTAINAINAAAQTPGPINVYAFSGGAEAFTAAINSGLISNDVINRIQSVTYLSAGIGPGDIFDVPQVGVTEAFHGHGFIDRLANFLGPKGTQLPCSHDFNCEFQNALVPKHASDCPDQTFARGHSNAVSSGGGMIFWYQNPDPWGIGGFIDWINSIGPPLEVEHGDPLLPY